MARYTITMVQHSIISVIDGECPVREMAQELSYAQVVEMLALAQDRASEQRWTAIGHVLALQLDVTLAADDLREIPDARAR